jgi:hypothetical protein
VKDGGEVRVNEQEHKKNSDSKSDSDN